VKGLAGLLFLFGVMLAVGALTDQPAAPFLLVALACRDPSVEDEPSDHHAHQRGLAQIDREPAVGGVGHRRLDVRAALRLLGEAPAADVLVRESTATTPAAHAAPVSSSRLDRASPAARSTLSLDITVPPFADLRVRRST
jgi:hypothetical protein